MVGGGGNNSIKLNKRVAVALFIMAIKQGDHPSLAVKLKHPSAIKKARNNIGGKGDMASHPDNKGQREDIGKPPH